MYNFKIAESKNFQKIKKNIDKKFYEKIVNIVYPKLRKNPFFGPNIKKLKGKFEGYYRYRIGDYRLFYLIDNDKVIVIITNFKHRKNSYD